MDENQIIDELKAQDIDFVSAIPCDRAKDLFFRLPEAFRYIGLTREEDGVGISAGAYLAGARPLVALQSSGLGNMLNAILSLTVTFGLPLPILASWRGGTNETIPAQIPFNRPLPRILAAAGIPCTILSNRNNTRAIGDTIALAYRKQVPHVILIRPGCIDTGGGGCLPSGKKIPDPTACRRLELSYVREWRDPVMTRYDAIAAIANEVTDEVLVSNIGIPSKELFATGDRNENFYMLGSYTQASPIGLGIATVRPDKRVIVLDGDGSLLGSSVLPVIGATIPENLTIVGLDNGVFGSTGNQPRPGSDTADLRLLARGYGFRQTWTVHEPQELASALAASDHNGPAFIHVRIRPGNREVPNIPLKPEQIRDRFRSALANGSGKGAEGKNRW